MTTIPLKPLYDRSRVVQDWKCPRARYWGYEYGGLGIAKSSTSLELFIGITIHDSFAAIASDYVGTTALGIDLIASTAFKQVYEQLTLTSQTADAVEFAKEQGSLVEGIVRGYHKHIWPRLTAQYPRILFVEEEMTYEHDDLIFMAKPDLIMANDESTVYVEFKSTKSKKDEWITSWDTAVQLHSTIRAVRATKGVDIDSVIIQGLYKGYESWGKQSSPFCYGYFRRGNPPFTRDDTTYEYKQGYRRIPTWEMDGGLKKWVEEMPEAVLANQFPQTAPIFVNDPLVDAFFRQRGFRENEIAKIMETEPDEALLDFHFPQKFDQCQPAYGWKCEFIRLCHGHVTDPLSEGYVWRTPHHSTEVTRLEELDGQEDQS
jgi:hypothetical protein